MNTSNNTILITGGGSGIGFETAKQFYALDNKIILVGRNAEKLKAASKKLGDATYIVADITKAEDVDELVKTIIKDHPSLNVLINNAGQAFLHNVADSDQADFFARQEMETNYFAIIKLTNKLLPLLKKQKESAIVNVSSVVAYAPGLFAPTYSASKAALHSYTQALRLSLSSTSEIKVFEILPPLVDTEFAKEISTTDKISPGEVAEDIIENFAKNNYEVRVSIAKNLYENFLTNADKAVLALNGLPLK